MRRWDELQHRVPIRRHPKNRALIDTAKDVARNLDVEGMFVRDHRVWVVLLLTRTEKRVTVACQRYSYPDRRCIYSFGAGDAMSVTGLSSPALA